MEETVLDPQHGLLAPQAEVKAAPEKVKGPIELLLEKFERKSPIAPEKTAADKDEVVSILSTLMAEKSPLNPHPLKTLRKNRGRGYSRTTALTKFRGRSTSTPFFTAIK